MSEEFLDAAALESNEKSTISFKNLFVLFSSYHRSLPHAVSFCLETGYLMVIGRVANAACISYFKEIPSELRDRIVAERRITFQNGLYVRECMKLETGYKREIQLPVSIYSNQASISSLSYMRALPGGRHAFQVDFCKKTVDLKTFRGQNIRVESPAMRGELVITIDAEVCRSIKGSGKIVKIGDIEADFRDIDYALLACLSYVEW